SVSSARSRSSCTRAGSSRGTGRTGPSWTRCAGPVRSWPTTSRATSPPGSASPRGPDSMHGLMPFELATLVRLGCSTRDALIAGTRGGAEACRVDAEVGTLTPGKRADLIAIDGNPLENIDALRNIRLVMKDGVIYSGPDCTPHR